MISDFIYLGVLISALVVVIAAAISDWRKYKIPNYFSILLILLYPVVVLTSPIPIDWLYSIGVTVIVFAIGFTLFAAGLFGGGDVKIITALALWSGPPLLLTFLIGTVLAGGLLVIVVIAKFAVHYASETGGLFNGARKAVRSKTPVPYGVAIAVGSLPVFYTYIKNSSFLG